MSLLIVRLLVALANYRSFAYLPKLAPLATEPFLSILIPARNEEDNIGNLLGQLIALDYPRIEIIVYNDLSADNTKGIVEHWVKSKETIKLIDGQQLPKGWLGKNHACHQLSKAASGSLLLFLDADVSVHKDLIKRSIAHLEKYNLQLLSIFPKQIVKSLGERVSVPLMNWILLSLLPLSLIRKSKNPAFSAANGQFMLFNAVTYKTIWPHEKYRLHRVEDIAILKYFKQKGFATDTLLGDNDISCRMYKGLDVAIAGFTKNIFQFFGDSKLVAILFGVLTTIAPFVLYFEMGIWWSLAYITGVLSIRLFVSLASQQSVIQNILLAVPQQLVFLLIIARGLFNSKQKKLIWKGRNILQE